MKLEKFKILIPIEVIGLGDSISIAEYVNYSIDIEDTSWGIRSIKPKFDTDKFSVTFEVNEQSKTVVADLKEATIRWIPSNAYSIKSIEIKCNMQSDGTIVVEKSIIEMFFINPNL